jgi:hypothetical protein
MLEFGPGYNSIFQTDQEFAGVPQIRHGGCFFLSILRALAAYYGLPWTHEGILYFYNLELANGKSDVDNEMFIGSAQNLIDDYAGPGKLLYLGEKPADYVAAPDEIEWGCWHRGGTDFNHFTHGTIKPVLFDPWVKEGSASVAQGVLVSKRIAKIIVPTA